jgi:hypothetical protein
VRERVLIVKNTREKKRENQPNTNIKQPYPTVRARDEQHGQLWRWVKLRSGDLTLRLRSLVGITQPFNGEHTWVQTGPPLVTQYPTRRRDERVQTVQSRHMDVCVCVRVRVRTGIDLCPSPFSPGGGGPFRSGVHLDELSPETPFVLGPLDRVFFRRIAQLAQACGGRERNFERGIVRVCPRRCLAAFGEARGGRGCFTLVITGFVRDARAFTLLLISAGFRIVRVFRWTDVNVVSCRIPPVRRAIVHEKKLGGVLGN